MSIDAVDAMEKFFTRLGCRRVKPKRQMMWVLDRFSSEFYLLFDIGPDDDNPDLIGTADAYVCTPGSNPLDSETRIRIAMNLRRHGVMRLLFAIGVERFSETTRRELYSMNNVLRTQ